MNTIHIAILFMTVALSSGSQLYASGKDTITNTLGMSFTAIPAGSFIMGTQNIEKAAAEMPKPNLNLVRDEQPAHKVIFTKMYYLGVTEVTQQQWLSIMNTRPGPESHWQHKHWQTLPVVSVSWLDAQQFIETLNKSDRQYLYRLPSEAEWEYAARAGNKQLRPFSILEMDEYAWYLHSSNDEIQSVATRRANKWGLFDMYGNAWEWVADWYSPNAYSHHSPVNPAGPERGSKKIRRGGSYHCPPHLIRPGYRAADLPDKAYSVLGVRLVAEKR